MSRPRPRRVHVSGPPTSLAALPIAVGPDRGPATEIEALPASAGPSTRAVHAGRRPDRNAGAVVPPIYQTSTFHYPAEFSEAGPGGTRIYTRYTNPTQEAAAETVRSLEGGGAARVFGSGMAAISTTLLTFLSAGDTIAASEELYGGTAELLRTVLPRLGIRVAWVPRG